MVHDNSDPGCRPKSALNLAGFLARSEVNGPGIRAVVWVQGCPIHCEGCFNPQSWSFSPAHVVAVDDLAKQILTLDEIDGVTFSGGEPFAQAAALADLGNQLKCAGLSIVTYTGYTHDEILRKSRLISSPPPDGDRPPDCRALSPVVPTGTPVRRLGKPGYSPAERGPYFRSRSAGDSLQAGRVYHPAGRQHHGNRVSGTPSHPTGGGTLQERVRPCHITAA